MHNREQVRIGQANVCDVLPARIEKCVAFLGLAKCAGTMAWEWSVAE
jgi:hypothetical protein